MNHTGSLRPWVASVGQRHAMPVPAPLMPER